MKSNKVTLSAVLLGATVAMTTAHAGNSDRIGSPPQPVPPIANPCPRLAASSVVEDPPALFSRGGVLTANFSYETIRDEAGRTLFCFMTPDGLENPTLHVRPGDHLVINVTNNTPSAPVEMEINPPNCGATEMTGSSMNLHFHGTNTSPTCHQDDVIHTTINSGQTFGYDVQFPWNEPPGLYWYHPHIHGMAEAAVQGGATGAIVVDGLEALQPAVRGLPQRVLVVRDQNVAGNPTPGGPDNVPSWDLSLNFIPISYPHYSPAVIEMLPDEKQLWRIANTCADTILHLQLQYDGEPQDLEVVALDGVPTGSQDGTRRGRITQTTDILLAPAARAEFIVTGPSRSVRNAALVTLAVDTGPDGDNDPKRPLATIRIAGRSRNEEPRTAEVAEAPWPQRFEGLRAATPTAERRLYFSEVLSDPSNPLSPTNFFITVDGATPEVFNANNPPAIVTTQGSVEDWTIENRSLEVHEFHIHQIHFLVRSQNNFEINGSQPDPSVQDQYLDMIQVPYWDGNPDHPYPSVTVRMDFRGPDIGDFVYHCHILGHEDNGMMAIIRVEPSSAAAALERFRIALGSLFGWFRASGAPPSSAWCVGGRPFPRAREGSKGYSNAATAIARLNPVTASAQRGLTHTELSER
jgi:FtsP/CotA-like multicopper oxidase with cupredoxin domain